MIAVQSDNYLTPQAYLELEQESQIKHEYINGQVYAMAGSSKAHNTISLNLALRLREGLRDSPCQTFMADVKVSLANQNKFFYPDLVVTCDENDNQDSYIVQFPHVIIEILSQSTEAFDRGEKFQYYRTLSSLQEYILVNSQRYVVDCFRRRDNNLWMLQSYEGLEAVARIETLGIEVSLSDIYATLDLNDSDHNI